MIEVVNDLLYLRDAYLRFFDATVVGARVDAVTSDRTAFYPTGGRRPNGTGPLSGTLEGGADVTRIESPVA